MPNLKPNNATKNLKFDQKEPINVMDPKQGARDKKV